MLHPPPPLPPHPHLPANLPHPLLQLHKIQPKLRKLLHNPRHQLLHLRNIRLLQALHLRVIRIGELLDLAAEGFVLLAELIEDSDLVLAEDWVDGFYELAGEVVLFLDYLDLGVEQGGVALVQVLELFY